MSVSLSYMGRSSENIEEHKMVIGAIRSGDGELAESVAQFHVRKSREKALKTIERDGWA